MVAIHPWNNQDAVELSQVRCSQPETKPAHLYCEFLKIFVEVCPEPFFQTVAVKAKQALHTISAAMIKVLSSQLSELQVHCQVEVIPEEVAPKSEQGIYFLRFTCTWWKPIPKITSTPHCKTTEEHCWKIRISALWHNPSSLLGVTLSSRQCHEVVNERQEVWPETLALHPAACAEAALVTCPNTPTLKLLVM